MTTWPSRAFVSANGYLGNLNLPEILRVGQILHGLAGGTGERNCLALGFLTWHAEDENCCSSAVLGVGKGLKIASYTKNAAEKMSRVNDRRHGQGHIHEYASSQSADEAKGTYGGCILGMTLDGLEVSGSISGFHPLADEAISFGLIKQAFGLIVPDSYRDLNPLIHEAIPLMGNVLKK